ncbi:hypothetical protein [Rhizobium leguminosarum]|nr:hypothetical protein [Rhizobium leguminosarum]
MATPERKVIRELRLDEISAVHRGAVEGAVVTIMKVADGHDRTKPVTALKNIKLDEVSLVERGANQFANVALIKTADPVPVAGPVAFSANDITPEGQVMLAKMLAAIRSETFTKSATHHEEVPTMSHYESLLKSFSDRHGVSRQKAHERLMESDPEKISDSYALDEAQAAKRLRDAQNATSY